MKKKKNNWIITSLTVYIVLLVIYMFRDQSEFWTSYYWLTNSYIAITGLLIGFFGINTPQERIAVCFIILARILLALYYVSCLIWVHDISILEGHLAFWTAFMVAGFMSIRFRKRYMYGND